MLSDYSSLFSMSNSEAIEFVKEEAEKQIGKKIEDMTVGEKDEVLVVFAEDRERSCILTGRIYPFDDLDEDYWPIYFQKGVLFQVEIDGDIEDYSSFEIAIHAFQAALEGGSKNIMDTILLGDCLHHLTNFPDESIDLCITDPPYKIDSRGTVGKNAKRKVGGMLQRNDGKVFDNNDIKFSDWLPEVYRVLKPNSHFYVFSNFKNLETLMAEGRKAGFKIHNLLIWHKNNCTPSQFYMKNCEYVVFFRKGKAKWINNIGSKTVETFINVKSRVHPTEKPVDLLKHYILNSSNENDVVLDPFSGSGSLAEACILTNRHFIGIEKDEGFLKESLLRIRRIKKII